LFNNPVPDGNAAVIQRPFVRQGVLTLKLFFSLVIARFSFRQPPGGFNLPR
jgi:hypothetical protein